MEPLNKCHICNKPIGIINEVKKEGKFYHQKCLNPNSKQNNKEEEKKNFTHERRLTLTLKNKYSDLYFGKTLMTEVVRPYLQFKYEIKKNKYLELIPQISMYFQDIEENKVKELLENEGLEIFKNELKELFGEECIISLNNVVVGSLLSRICVMVKPLKNLGEKAINKFLKAKNKAVELAKKAIKIIETHSFKSIKGLKPNAVKFVNQQNLENEQNNKKLINEFLKEKIETNYDAKSNWSLESSTTDLGWENDSINDESVKDIFTKIQTIAENEEVELINEIKTIKDNENFNSKLKINLEKSFKESIFEFRITGLVVINKDKQREKYEQAKSQCPNCETKILFHATQIKFSSEILTTNFIVGKDNWFGMGIYFADQFDYAKYYYNRNDNFALLPKMNDSFSIVVSEVFYDKTKFRHIYDESLHKILNKTPTEEEINGVYNNYAVPKNGIHYIEVDGENGVVINEQKEVITQYNRYKIPEGRFVGREYCITCKEQIFPLYGLNFQRVDYCVIWRDSNFDSFEWKEPLKKNKEIIQEMTGYNLYTESDTQSALKLVWRKRFNRIILITNVGYNLEGKTFVDKARKILGFDVMVLFFVNDFNHLNWIKDYPNCLFCMDDYTVKEYVFNFNEEGFKKIRDNIKDFYGIEIKEPKNPFDYPLFEKYKEGYFLYSELDVGEYKDVD